MIALIWHLGLSCPQWNAGPRAEPRPNSEQIQTTSEDCACLYDSL